MIDGARAERAGQVCSKMCFGDGSYLDRAFAMRLRRTLTPSGAPRSHAASLPSLGILLSTHHLVVVLPARAESTQTRGLHLDRNSLWMTQPTPPQEGPPNLLGFTLPPHAQNGIKVVCLVDAIDQSNALC